MSHVDVSTVKGQVFLCNDAARKNADADRTFLHLVETGMTKRDLERCIEKRPAFWSRYKHWLPKLPDVRPPSSRSA